MPCAFVLKTLKVQICSNSLNHEMTPMESALSLTVVAFLWGATNPLIKLGSQGIEKIKENNAVKQFLCEFKFLLLNWKYVIPFLVNQCGSVVYYYTLASAEMSLTVPIANSLAFVFTTLVGRLLGEKIQRWETYLGMCLVITGVMFCIVAKL
ncbi:transmembrane protein 234 homolog [Liolophura sinensis]|uniref:transmembrane protein 234 homolog n=1 Tax=Liolophura sinensis TaxID=3198878 RepID=UPI0031584B43